MLCLGPFATLYSIFNVITYINNMLPIYILKILFICRWITPVLLLIDFYEKMAVSSKRRAQMNKVGAR